MHAFQGRRIRELFIQLSAAQQKNPMILDKLTTGHSKTQGHLIARTPGERKNISDLPGLCALLLCKGSTRLLKDYKAATGYQGNK